MSYYIFAVARAYHYELITAAKTMKGARDFMDRYEKDNPEYRGKLGIYKKVS